MIADTDINRVLLAAADRIEQYGFAQGSWTAPNAQGLLLNNNCRTCVGGALTLAASHNTATSPITVSFSEGREVIYAAIEKLVSHLGLVRDPDAGGDTLDLVINWNDEQSQEEVVAALRAAAA